MALAVLPAEKALAIPKGTNYKVDTDSDGNRVVSKVNPNAEASITFYGIEEEVWDHNNANAALKSITFKDGIKFGGDDIAGAFAVDVGTSNLTSIDLSGLDTSDVKYMANLFVNQKKLTSVTFGGYFNTSNVIDMTGMFHYCESLEAVDLSSFDTSSVEIFSVMFDGCKNLKSLDLSGFNTAAATEMIEVFGSCESLTSLDLSNFNTSNVIAMNSLFHNCKSLTSLNISGFDTSNVTNMVGMFSNCEATVNVAYDKCGGINGAGAQHLRIHKYYPQKTAHLLRCFIMSMYSRTSPAVQTDPASYFIPAFRSTCPARISL